MSKYQDNVQRLLTLMESTFGTDFKTYYDGDPEAIPDFNLPALIVSLSKDDTEDAAYEQEDVTENVVIKVVLNKKDDFENDAVDPLNMTERKIRDFVGKRNKDTGRYELKTIKGALSRAETDGLLSLAPRISVEYGIVPRINNMLTAEGHVTFSITYTVDVEDLAI